MADSGASPLHPRTFDCVVVTPEDTLLETDATFVALPLFDGELGIAPLHSPMIGRLGYGEMRVTDFEGVTHRFYVDGGFVQVADDRVSVLTGRAILAGAIDAADAADRLSTAYEQVAHGDEQIALRQKQLEQARAQVRVARRAAVPSQ
ncbi:MAG: ATP synthase F1 subunit epsilon [Pirellulales bacterium]